MRSTANSPPNSARRSKGRIQAPATAEQRQRLAALSPESIAVAELAGEKVTAALSRAPGNDAPIGGIKLSTEHGWFAARPSGTEDIDKIYAESFSSAAHLQRVLNEAQTMVDTALASPS